MSRIFWAILVWHPHGVDGDQRAADRQPVEQQRDGGDLVGLGGACLLTEHQPLAAGPGGDQVERIAILRPVMGAAGCLAVDGDDLGAAIGIRIGGAQACHPCGEAGREQPGVDGIEDVVERVVARDAVSERQEAAEKIHMQTPPAPDFHEVLGTGDRAAKHDEQHLGQRKNHLPGLSWIAQSREVVEKGNADW